MVLFFRFVNKMRKSILLSEDKGTYRHEIQIPLLQRTMAWNSDIHDGSISWSENCYARARRSSNGDLPPGNAHPRPFHSIPCVARLIPPGTSSSSSVVKMQRANTHSQLLLLRWTQVRSRRGGGATLRGIYINLRGLVRFGGDWSGLEGVRRD